MLIPATIMTCLSSLLPVKTNMLMYGQGVMLFFLVMLAVILSTIVVLSPVVFESSVSLLSECLQPDTVAYLPTP